MFKKLSGMLGGDDKNDNNQGQSHFQMTPQYQQWREMIFNLKAEDVGFKTDGANKVFGTIMDVGLPGGRNFVVSVSAFTTMECSMRTSFGGGLSGVGEHPQINQQLQAIIPLTQKLVSQAEKASKPKLPTSGIVHFHYLTTDGLYTYGAPIQQLMTPQHPYSELFGCFSQVKAIIDQLFDEMQKNQQ
ncbi:MAG: hypothetical protein AAF846_26075 [Chloroflexota bacterium]